jgi:hypothetical protein
MKKRIQNISVLLVLLFIQVLPVIQSESFWVFNDKG